MPPPARQPATACWMRWSQPAGLIRRLPTKQKPTAIHAGCFCIAKTTERFENLSTPRFALYVLDGATSLQYTRRPLLHLARACRCLSTLDFDLQKAARSAAPLVALLLWKALLLPTTNRRRAHRRTCDGFKSIEPDAQHQGCHHNAHDAAVIVIRPAPEVARGRQRLQLQQRNMAK